MVQTIDQALITEFSAMVHHEAQQEVSKLRPYVITKQIKGDNFKYDGLGRVQAREITGRNVPAIFDDVTHNTRKLSRRRFVINLPVDASDMRGALLDIEGEYAKAIAAEMLRQTDRVIYDAAFADVRTGLDFNTIITAAQDGVTTVDATGGLIYEKLLEINQNWIDNDVMANKPYLTITGDEYSSLMGEVELTSGDFSRQFAIEKGQITSALGMDLIALADSVENPIIPTVGGERNLIAATERAICLGISKEMGIKITERDDYVETNQVQVVMEIGAVRTEGALIQKVRVTA